MPEPDAPKIIVDSDWKSQAQAEKERLAAAQKPAPAPKPASGDWAAAAGAAPPPPGGRALPPADFQTLIGTFVTQAILYLGGFPDPKTGRAIVALDYARFHIDLLAVLEEKCRGNLTPDEEADLKQSLYELRMRYVEISKAVAEMAAGNAPVDAGTAGAGPRPTDAGPKLKL